MQKIKEQITQKEHILDADKEGFLHLMNRRYLRHFSLFGKEGQDALLHSGILVIGAGGIGCSVLYNIAAAGIGKIGIIDPGRIFLPHLNRRLRVRNSISGKKEDSTLFDRRKNRMNCPMQIIRDSTNDKSSLLATLAAGTKIFKYINILQMQTTGGACSIAQAAAVGALSTDHSLHILPKKGILITFLSIKDLKKLFKKAETTLPLLSGTKDFSFIVASQQKRQHQK